MKSFQEHGSKLLEDKLKENEKQLVVVTESLHEREGEIQEMQEKLVSYSICITQWDT